MRALGLRILWFPSNGLLQGDDGVSFAAKESFEKTSLRTTLGPALGSSGSSKYSP